MITRAIRLPLQTGGSAANRVLGSLFTGIPFALLFAIGARDLGTFVVVGLPLGAIFGLVTYLLLKAAFERQASDALLTPGGLTIVSGPANGLSVAWSDIEPDYSKVDVIRDPRRPDDSSPRAELYLFRRSTDAVCVARTNDPEEQRSFEALLACIRAGCSGAAPPIRRRETEVLACPGCGAVAAPADAAVVACHFCGGRAVVPEDVRARIRASREVSSSPDALLAERLLSQPGAGRINSMLRVGTLVFYAAAPIAMLLGAEIGAILAAALLFAIVSVARALIADRAALRALVLGFGAHAPSREGEPETCRACKAPLPAVEAGRAMLHCAFCGAVNLSGMDLRCDASVARSAESELRSALASRSSRRAAAWIWLFVSLMALGAVGAVAYVFAMRRF